MQTYQLYNTKEKKFEDRDILLNKEQAENNNRILNTHNETFIWKQNNNQKELNFKIVKI